MAFYFVGQTEIRLNEIEELGGKLVPRQDDEIANWVLEIATEGLGLEDGVQLMDIFAFTLYDNITGQVYDARVKANNSVVLQRRT